MALFISAEGYPVLTAADAQEAEALVQACPGGIRAVVSCASEPDEAATISGIRTFWPDGRVVILPSALAEKLAALSEVPEWSFKARPLLPHSLAGEMRQALRKLDEIV
jgi:hypothetical protein